MTMKLYTYFRSSAAYRVRITLNFKKLDYESVFIHLRKGEQKEDSYLSINPQGLLPSFEHEGHLFTQSLAILEYLEESYPTPPLLPQSSSDRAYVRSMAQTIACEIHPLNNLRVLHYLKKTLHHSEEETHIWYRHWISMGFQALEATISQNPATTYCYGNCITLADVCLVPQIFNAKRFKTDLSPYPNLTRISEKLQEIPAFANAAPHAQPDAEQ